MMKGAFVTGKGAEPGKGKSKGKTILSTIDASMKVWVGGLPEGTSQVDLEAHFEQVGRVTWGEPMPRGTACVAFGTAEESATAIEMLNGSELGGTAIQVDVWTRGANPSSAPVGIILGGGKKGAGGVSMPPWSSGAGKGAALGRPTSPAPAPQAVWKPMFDKPQGAGGASPAKGEGKGKGKNPLKSMDSSLKVWVNNLPDHNNWKNLEAHFQQVGKTKWVEIMPRGTACVAYSTAEEAEAALGLNGIEFEGQVLEVDVWETKPRA